jgi:hypothetical protein
MGLVDYASVFLTVQVRCRLNFFIALLGSISCPISLNDPDGDIFIVGPPAGVTRLDGQ